MLTKDDFQAEICRGNDGQPKFIEVQYGDSTGIGRALFEVSYGRRGTYAGLISHEPLYEAENDQWAELGTAFDVAEEAMHEALQED